MNTYELTVVVDAKRASALKKKTTDTIESLIKVFKGKVASSKEWGVKEMAYKIQKTNSGLYMFFELELEPSSVKPVNDKLRVDKDILRYLLVKKN